MQVQWVRVQLNGGREKEFALLIQSARAARSTCEDKIKTMHVSRFPCIDLDGPGIAAGENGAVAILATDRELVAAGKGRLPSVCQANRKMGIIKRSLEPGIHPSTGRSDCGDIVAVGRLLGDVGEKGCPPLLPRRDLLERRLVEENLFAGCYSRRHTRSGVD